MSQFVPYYLSLKLKRLGFNEECFAVYFNGTFFGSPSIFNKNENRKCYLYDCIAPLWQQAFDWIIEHHQLFHYIDRHGGWWVATIQDFSKEETEGVIEIGKLGKGYFKTIPEAKLACLEKLIDHIKTNIK